MENNILDNQGGSQQLSSETMYQLTQLAKWMNLAAILSMVGQVLAVIEVIKTGKFSSILGAVIGFLLAFMLFKAAKGLKSFTADGDQVGFEVYGKNIRQYFLVVGILLIILFVFVLAFMAIGLSAIR